MAHSARQRKITMSVAELFPTIQSLSLADKEQLFRYLSAELAGQIRDLPPLPVGFPPAQDSCPATRDELEASRREPGIYTLEEIWRSLKSA
jgi:hypothetical protein